MTRPVPDPGWTGGLPHVLNDVQHVSSCAACRRFLRRARRYPQGITPHRRPGTLGGWRWFARLAREERIRRTWFAWLTAVEDSGQ